MINVEDEVNDLELLARYMHVSRCWNDYKQAVSNKMTSEKAILELKHIIDTTKSPRLKKMAEQLQNKVIYEQADNGLAIPATVWE